MNDLVHALMQARQRRGLTPHNGMPYAPVKNPFLLTSDGGDDSEQQVLTPEQEFTPPPPPSENEDLQERFDSLRKRFEDGQERRDRLIDGGQRDAIDDILLWMEGTNHPLTEKAKRCAEMFPNDLVALTDCLAGKERGA